MLESSGLDWKYIPYSGQVYLYPFFWLTVYCVIIQLFFRLWRPCDCCSPDYWMLALAVGESGGSQLLLLLEGLCGPAPALLFPLPPCLSHSELFRYVFSDGSCFLPFQGLCPCCSLCLEYFIQDSLQPDLHQKTLAPAQKHSSCGNPSRPSGYTKFF